MLQSWGLRELFCLLAKARQNKVTGRQWEDVYKTNMIRNRKLKGGKRNVNLETYYLFIESRFFILCPDYWLDIIWERLVITFTSNWLTWYALHLYHTWTVHIDMEGIAGLWKHAVVFSYMKISHREYCILWRKRKCWSWDLSRCLSK